MSCHVSCHVISCHVMPCRILSYPTIHMISRYSISSITPHHISSWHTTPQHTTPHTIPYHTIPYHTIPLNWIELIPSVHNPCETSKSIGNKSPQPCTVSRLIEGLSSRRGIHYKPFVGRSAGFSGRWGWRCPADTLLDHRNKAGRWEIFNFQRAHDAIITSMLWHRNDVATSFWRQIQIQMPLLSLVQEVHWGYTIKE